MKARYLPAAACLLLATCCPTLWLQVTKTDPSPWPELPRPAALPPHVPAMMQNRFDVLEHGTLTRFAETYSDTLDPRDNQAAQRTAMLAGLDAILHRYRVDASAEQAGIPGSAECAVPGVVGQDAFCLGVHVAKKPTSGWISVNGQLRAVSTVEREPRGFLVGVTTPIDDVQLHQTVSVRLDASLSKTLLSFVHISDIQLRDPSVVLTDRRLSKRLDWFEPLSSFEYDEDLAFYNQYLFEAMVETINEAAAQDGPDAPKFVIHTGDSIDSNMMSELDRFHRIIDRLRIPFFEVFGNHDVLVFGNLTPTSDAASGNDAGCTPVAALLGGKTWLAPNKLCVDVHVKPCPTCTASQMEFVASPDGHAITRARFMERLHHDESNPVVNFPVPVDAKGKPVQVPPYCDRPSPIVDVQGYTRDHGFDLLKSNGQPRGYYAFARPLDEDRNAVFVVLDGEELPDGQGGIYAHVGHDQVAWLREVFECVRAKHKQDMVFVFAHQPLSMLQVDKVDEGDNVESILDRNSMNVVAFLYGHHHRHAICDDNRFTADKKHRTTCTHFWEVQTGSLVEYPQEARLVRIKQVAPHLGFLEVSTFAEQLVDPGSQLAHFVQLARRGAERDWCVTNDARCSDDKRVYREDGNATAARLFFKIP